MKTVFVVLHVPKCAGRTVERHMEAHLPDQECWITRKRRFWLPYLTPRRYLLPESSKLAHLRFVSGHYVGRSLEGLLPARPIKRAVLIREPLSFMLSYYNFRMMRYIREGWRPYSFEVHLRSLPCDPICHFLLSRWLELPWLQLLAMSPERKYELLNETLSRFWYVADYSYCDRLVELLSEDLGVPAKAERQNTRESWENRVAWTPLNEVPPQMRREIEERTRLDRALWETWGEAQLGAGRVRPAPLKQNARLTFALSEARRPAFEVARRTQRGWF
jgi:hypothetical protein